MSMLHYARRMEAHTTQECTKIRPPDHCLRRWRESPKGYMTHRLISKIIARVETQRDLTVTWPSSSGDSVATTGGINSGLSWMIHCIVLNAVAYPRMQSVWGFNAEGSSWRKGTWTKRWKGAWAWSSKENRLTVSPAIVNIQYEGGKLKGTTI